MSDTFDHESDAWDEFLNGRDAEYDEYDDYSGVWQRPASVFFSPEEAIDLANRIKGTKPTLDSLGVKIPDNLRRPR